MFWLPAGAVETFRVPPPLSQAPHVPFPNRQVPPFAVPDPNSAAGTSPAIRSAFDPNAVSTYSFGAACNGATGFPFNVSEPVIVPPATGRKFPAPTVPTAVSTYALFATSPVFTGAGTFGESAKLFNPVTVSSPVK